MDTMKNAKFQVEGKLMDNNKVEKIHAEYTKNPITTGRVTAHRDLFIQEGKDNREG